LPLATIIIRRRENQRKGRISFVEGIKSQLFYIFFKTPEQYKPASQRVHDAAQSLLHSLFSTKIPTTKTSSTSNFVTKKFSFSSINELVLIKKFGLKLDKFEHFLLRQQNVLISLYEAQNIPTLSKGFLLIFF